MEDTGYTPDQVHVLRQTFRPNEPFHAALSELIVAGPSGPRPFSIYGSDERLIEMSEVSSRSLTIQKFDADKYLETKRNVHLQLEGEVSARILKTSTRGAVALQLIMKPADILEYAHIRRGLDTIQVGRRTHAIGFEATRLYANIPFDQLRPIPEVKENIAHMNAVLADSSTHHLYQLTPLPYLLGQFVPRAGRELKEVTYPQEHAS